MHKYFVFTET